MDCHIEPTIRCNIRCGSCIGRSLVKGMPVKDLPMEAFLNTIDSKYLNTVSLFNRGESFLHPQFAEMVRMLKERKVFVSVCTNGMLLQEKGQALVEAGIDNITVALDGITTETHTAYRHGADFRKILDGIKFINQLRARRRLLIPRLTMQFIIFKSNVHELTELERFARIAGFDVLRVKTTCGDLAPEDLSRNSLGTLFANQKCFRPTPIQESRTAEDLWTFHGIQIPDEMDVDTRRICFKPVVLCNGDVVSCCWDGKGENILGHVDQNMTLDEVLEGPRYREFLTSLMSRTGWDFCNRAVCSQRPRLKSDAASHGAQLRTW